MYDRVKAEAQPEVEMVDFICFFLFISETECLTVGLYLRILYKRVRILVF